MNRRDLLALAALAAAPRAVRGQQAQHVAVIGTLSHGFPVYDAAIVGLTEGLRELGYVEGKTVKIEAR
jgi:hypothetical protein